MGRFAELIPAQSAQRIKTLHLVANRIEHLGSDVFVGLPRLHTLRIEGNPIKCDCSIQNLFQKLRESNVYPKISCDKPSDFVMTNLNAHFLNSACGTIH